VILDIKTLVTVVIIICCTSAFALTFFYRISKQFYGLKYAAIGAGLQAVGAISLFVRHPDLPTLTMVTTNISNLMACIFYYQAARLLCDRKTSWTYPLLFMAALLPLFYIYRLPEFTFERVIASLIATGVLALFGSYMVFKNADRLPGRLILAVTFFLSGPICFLSVLSMTASADHAQSYAELKEFQYLFLWFIINTTLISFSFIILTSEKLQQQLKEQVELLARARDIATKSLQQQRHFLSMLSHEFKAPIASIRANTDLIDYTQKDKAPEVEASLNRIKNVSTRLSTLVDHCLNNEWLAHSIEQHQERLEPVSLTLVLTSICDEFSVKFKGNIEDAIINGEAMFLPVLFSNLVSNACKHAKNRDAVQLELSEQGEHYQVRISDDGLGIPEQQQQHIFERYYQTESGQAEGGSGLGLYFVKRITEMHGGTVSVNCEQNTIFTVTLAKLKNTDFLIT